MPPPRAFLVLLLPLLFACEVKDARTLQAGAACDPRESQRCEGPGAFCLDLGAGAGICSHACRVDTACPSGMTCQLDAGGATAHCAPGFRCKSDGDCPAGHRCDETDGGCYIPVRRGLCSPCNADAQCPDGGSCIEARATGERFCSTGCDAGVCPDNFECAAIRGSSQCLPVSGTCEARRPLCAPCEGDAQCGDGNDLCITNHLTGERFCGVSCNPACADGSCESVCPESFACADLSGTGVGPFQCVPHTDSCAGWCESDRACAPGEICDPENSRCVPATDGRACAWCANDDACSTNSRCVADAGAGASFCAPLCSDDADCRHAVGVGFVCASIGGNRLCVPGAGSCEGGSGRLGDACGEAGAAGCLSGICLRSGTAGICSGRCVTDDDCGDPSFSCCGLARSGDAIRWDCRLAPDAAGGVCGPKGGLFGDACEPGRPPCQHGHCLDLGTSRSCTAACGDDADCDMASGLPGGFVCRVAKTADALDERVRVCFPAGGGGVGSDCTFGPAACTDRLCITKPSGNLCTRPCGRQEDCPAGWSCEVDTTVDGRVLSLCLPAAVAG